MIRGTSRQSWAQIGRPWPITRIELVAMLGGLVLVFLLGLLVAGAAFVALLTILIFLVGIMGVFYRLEIGVYLFVIVLLNVTFSIFFNTGKIVLGSIILPGPLAFIAVFTIFLATAYKFLSGRFPVFFEPVWMAPLLLILLLQVAFVLGGHGTGIEVRRLQFTAQGLTAFPLVVLVLRRCEQVQRLLRVLALSYMMYSVLNIAVSLGKGLGYRFVDTQIYTLSAATTVAALMNLFIPVCFGAFLAETQRFWRKIYLASLFSTCLLSILTFSRGGLLGMGFSLLAWVGLGRCYLSRRMLVAIVGGLSLALVANFVYRVNISDPLSGSSLLGFHYKQTLRQIADTEHGGGRLSIYRNAWQAFLKATLLGIGAGKMPSHSLFLSAGLDGGVLLMGATLVLFIMLIRRSFRLWKRLANDPNWGPVALGLFISMTYAFIQNWLDMMLYAVAYGLIFWLLRGTESVLLLEARRTKTE